MSADGYLRTESNSGWATGSFWFKELSLFDAFSWDQFRELSVELEYSNPSISYKGSFILALYDYAKELVAYCSINEWTDAAKDMDMYCKAKGTDGWASYSSLDRTNSAWRGTLRLFRQDGQGIRAQISGLDSQCIISESDVDLDTIIKYIGIQWRRGSGTYLNTELRDIRITSTKTLSDSCESIFESEIKYRPYGWAPMTISPGKYYTANRYSQSDSHLWYDMSTTGSGQYGYYFMQYTHLNTIRVRGNDDPTPGSIGITGYFMKGDTFSSSLAPGRSYVRIYVLDESGQNILASEDVLTSNEGNGIWYYKSITIDGLDPGSNVRIGIGRRDAWSTDWHLYFAFRYIQVWNGA